MRSAIESHAPGQWATDVEQYQNRGHGYTRVGEIEVYGGPRLVMFETYAVGTGEPIADYLVSHAWIAECLSNLADALATEGDEVRFIATNAAYHLVLSDLETGTSIAAWPEMNRLVDMALSWEMAHREGQNVNVRTEWAEF